MLGEKHFRKSPKLESLLGDLNDSLQEVGLFESRPPELPTLLIMGVPRSGTTLLLQVLAASGRFGYPSNLIARFYGNPSIGVAIQRVLIENDHEGQIWAGSENWKSDSQLGRTYGALAPSEFWYYWRRFFPFDDEHRLDDEALKGVDVQGFLGGLGAMEGAIGKPLVMKGMMLTWHIPFLASINENFRFLHVERDLCETAMSVLRSRSAYSGNPSEWWSFKPPGYKSWLKSDPIEQVARQVLAIDRVTREGLAQLPEDRVVRVRYEEFCREPDLSLKLIGEKMLGDRCALLGDNFVKDEISGVLERGNSSVTEERMRQALNDYSQVVE